MIENDEKVYARYIDPCSREHRDTVYIDHGKFLLYDFGLELRDVSGGIGTTGYDLHLKEATTFIQGYTVLPFTIERVTMPDDLAAEIDGKSTWATYGISLNTTKIDPGFDGYIQLEASYCPKWRGWFRHFLSLIWPERLHLSAGTPIGTLVFLRVSTPKKYIGKYQGQGVKDERREDAFLARMSR